MYFMVVIVDYINFESKHAFYGCMFMVLFISFFFFLWHYLKTKPFYVSFEVIFMYHL
ncbi:hypothetical protein Lalb_Chr20g0113741 [Lupinus albus]|uniref:Uncharacterized protein n=1 Tax=Lupinus albus TaxID=3870 RepID=A0A6A4NP71_LUPAL|nr:hypothetical protein Lalb_Chr20g0113741 [Lupinus albus]